MNFQQLISFEGCNILAEGETEEKEKGELSTEFLKLCFHLYNFYLGSLDNNIIFTFTSFLKNYHNI